MSDPHSVHPGAVGAASAAMDPALRRYMLRIYGKVAAGLMLAAAVAFAVSGLAPDGALTAAAGGDGRAADPRLTGAGAALVLAPLGVLLSANLFLRNPSSAKAAALYGLFAAAVGGALGVVAQAFTGLSLATTFAVSASVFGGLCLFGYTSRLNLGGFGGFLASGLVGLLFALTVNLLLRSPALSYAVDAAGVLVFSGLAAYETQRLKLAYGRWRGSDADLSTATTYGALSLFLSFVNLFQLLLALGAGQRR